MEDDILHLDAPAIPEEKTASKGRWAAPVVGPAPEEHEGVISLEQPQPINTMEDVARSAAGQGVLGATDIGGLPGTMGQLYDLAAQKAHKYLVLKPLEAMGALPPGETAETAQKSAAELGKKFQSPAEQAGAVNTIAGIPFATGKGVEELTQEVLPFTKYEPKTTAGKFAGNAARTAVGMGEFGALASAAKGAGIGEAARNIAREAGVGAVAGAGSELAGQGAEAYLPEWASPYARFLGAVGGTMTGSKIADAVKYVAMPTPTASEALARALGKDIQGGHTPMTLDQINTAIAQGGMPTIFDMAGPETRKVLKYYGALTPEAEAAAAKMAKEMGERTTVSGQALGEHIEKNLGTSLDPAAKQAAIDAAAKTQNDALYNIARTSPNAKSVMNPELEGLMKIDAVKQAMKKANSAATDPQSGIVSYTPGTASKQVETGLFDQSGNPIMKTVQGSSATNPNLNYWDQVKRSLDDQIGAAITANKRDTVRRLTSIKNRLTDTLDKAVPEYATARNAAADAFGASNSIEAGYNALKGMNAFKIQDTLTALKGMPANEQKLFAQGAAGYLKEVAENGGPSAVVRMMDKPSISNRIRAAIGDQAADSIYGRAQAETLMAKTNALPPPPPTQGAAPASMLTKTLIGGAGAPAIEAAYNAAMHGAISPSALITAAVGATGAATLSAGMSFAEKRIAPRIMEMAASKDPAVIQELGRMAQGNNAVRSVLEKLNDAAETSLNSYYRSNPANVPGEQPRTARATGGAVNLMALSKAAKKHVTKSTEDLLNESDDTVTRALEVANKHI